MRHSTVPLRIKHPLEEHLVPGIQQGLGAIADSIEPRLQMGAKDGIQGSRHQKHWHDHGQEPPGGKLLEHHRRVSRDIAGVWKGK